MKYSLALLGAFVLAFSGLQPDVPYQISPESKLSFDGTSSMHDWGCEAGSVGGEVTVAEAGEGTVSAVDVVIPVYELDCGRNVMSNRVKSLLKGKEHPNITFRLREANALSQPDAQNRFRVRAIGDLSVAGETRPIEMVVDGRLLDDGRVRFSGTHPLWMTHFGVEPPAFLNVTTGDSISVKFDVIAEAK